MQPFAKTWPLLFIKRHLSCNLLLSDHVTLEQLEASIEFIFWAVFAIRDVLLPLDKASRAVFVTVSGSDGLADGREHFWSQLNNSKL